jgi:hypothetical protein
MKTQKGELFDVVTRFESGCTLRKWTVCVLDGNSYILKHKVKGAFLVKKNPKEAKRIWEEKK